MSDSNEKLFAFWTITSSAEVAASALLRLDFLKPHVPPDAHASVSPFSLVSVTIVLLNVVVTRRMPLRDASTAVEKHRRPAALNAETRPKGHMCADARLYE
jgi:hypothetical protein